MRIQALALLAILAAPRPVSAQSATRLPIDHVILAIDSLERGIRLFRELTGVTPVHGGAHPGAGTQNALVSLGRNRYLEIIAPNPADSSEEAMTQANRLPRDEHFTPLTKLTPDGWAIHVRDIANVAERISKRTHFYFSPEDGARDTPDGRHLSWQTLLSFGNGQPDVLPFLIEWDAGVRHPSLDAPRGCTLVSLMLYSAHARETAEAMKRIGYTMTVAYAPRDHIELTLQCPKGRVVFPAP